jgi:MoaA/NifB/PqqE/SkfB family radical SAM enzyme
LKVRFEARGLHFYDRVNGVHILADESYIPNQLITKAPSVLSIALSNICDLNCDFCYVPKNALSLEQSDVLNWCIELDRLGTLEIAFGGGEPTLYPHFAELCHRVWNETNLGISITTNGHHLTPSLVSKLVGDVSIIRISIDSLEPLYSKLRRRPLAPILDKISYLIGRVPVGINTIVNSSTLLTLDDMLQLVKKTGVTDWLLLPQVKNGQFTLSQDDWLKLENWINNYWHEVNLSITSGARRYINTPSLFSFENPDDYAHISADYHLRRCSYQSGGISLYRRTIQDGLSELKRLEQLSL